MAHQLASFNGRVSMFSVKETPWHGLGEVISDAPTVADGIELAGANWTVEEEGIQTNGGANLSEFGKAFVRVMPDGSRHPLSIVGPRTHPLQNASAFDWFNPFLESGLATLETAGCLDEGRKVWVLAKISSPNSIIRKDDEIAKFVMLSNSHDGTQAVRVGFTPIRIVCANTLGMAIRSKASQLIRVRHSKDVVKNVEKLRDVMNLANNEFEATAEQYRQLASRNINAADLRKYVKQVFDMDENDAELAPQSKRKIETIIERFEKRDMGNGQGTWWDAYNAITEQLNYGEGRETDTRINSLWFGVNAKRNETALATALTLAG